MDSFKDWITFWATILGTVLGVFGVIQSLAWLAVVGILFACGSVGVLLYARKQRLLVKSAVLKIAGRSIDSLNAASLRRRTNRSLTIQEVANVAIIDGEDLTITWHCSGYCRADRETAIEFSIDADTNTPFDDLECYAYDVRRDPRKLHPIQPILLGPDGISKKLAIPFLAPLSEEEPFAIVLKCKLPGCMRAGVDYYTATLSFDQERVERYSTRLIFQSQTPQWVRVYECRTAGDVKLLRSLPRVLAAKVTSEYLDADVKVRARSARIYVFFRDVLNAPRRRASAAEAA